MECVNTSITICDHQPSSGIHSARHVSHVINVTTLATIALCVMQWKEVDDRWHRGFLAWQSDHSHIVAKETFARVDANVWSLLWRWAVRRHPNKGACRVKEKYFKTRGTRNWVFVAKEEKEDGTQRELTLLKESDTPIQRHIKIKSHANPHDP